MTTVGNLSDINETFIIEPIFVSGDTVSACTSVYSNMILSCSGDTTISMGDGIITLDGNLYTNDNISATTLNASTFFSGGTNVIDIINNVDARLTGGTYNSSTRTLSLYDKKGITINITGVTGNYTTGTTLVGSTIYFNRNDAMSAYTVNLSSLTAATIYTANGTISSNRVVNIGSVDLSFSSSTYPNTLVLKNGNIGKGVSTPTNPFHLSAATDPIRIQGIQTSTDNLFLTIDNNGVIHNKTITIPSDTNAWSITGNSATTITTNFIGTVDENGLVFKTNNIISGYIDIINKNTSLGQYSLYSNFNGSGNTSIGYQTLYATGATQNIYCGGGFTDYDGNTAIRAVRVESDGSIDGGFVIGSGFDGTVYTIAIQDDGKILVGGDFTDYDGNTAIRAVRLNTDGSIDNSFASGGGFNGTVYTIAIQDDGKILVGGNFGGYDGNTAIRAVRLNINGSIDGGFVIGSGFDGTVYTIAIQDDGKILIGGDFTDYDGNTAIRIVRLNTDGSIDNSFASGSGFDGTVYTVAIQDDGKILVGGDFTDYDGNTAIRIVRLNTDGSIDGGFASGGGFNATVYTIAIQDDGKILVGGNFGGYDGNTAIRAVRLNTDGSIDNSFECLATGVKGIYVKTIAIQDDGKMLLGGDFTDYDGNTVNNIVRVESDGSIDGGFVIGSGFDGTVNIILLPTNAFASGCVAVGHQAGYGQTDSNKLYIANNSGSTLIYGDFNTPYVQVNGELSVSSTTASFIPPVMTEGERLALPLKLGSIVYQTDGDEGLYLYKTIGWVLIG